MNITWKLDLSQEENTRGNIEEVSMLLIANFRKIRQAQPYRIIIKNAGIGAEVADRLAAAGLPVVKKQGAMLLSK
jgi:hypothetical protein